MKLEEGMYVRSKCGIAKITSIVCGQDVHFDNEELENISPYDGISKDGTYWRENIIGEPSFNPIDLIEVGDYVNGDLVLFAGATTWDNDGNVLDKQVHINHNGYDWWLKEEYIKSIVTKEQFESISYEVSK